MSCITCLRNHWLNDRYKKCIGSRKPASVNEKVKRKGSLRGYHTNSIERIEYDGVTCS